MKYIRTIVRRSCYLLVLVINTRCIPEYLVLQYTGSTFIMEQLPVALKASAEQRAYKHQYKTNISAKEV